MDNKLIKVLSKNAIKCLICNTILESKHRHDFQQCNCSNKAFVDGGLEYQRILAMDLDEHETQVDEIKSEILKTLDKIDQVWSK